MNWQSMLGMMFLSLPISDVKAGETGTEKLNSLINVEKSVRKLSSLANPKNLVKTKDNGTKRGRPAMSAGGSRHSIGSLKKEKFSEHGKKKMKN
jgi:hypothetical protein